MGQEKVGTASLSVGNASHSHPVSTGWPRTLIALQNRFNGFPSSRQGNRWNGWGRIKSQQRSHPVETGCEWERHLLSLGALPLPELIDRSL